MKTFYHTPLIQLLMFFFAMQDAAAQDIFPPSQNRPTINAQHIESKLTVDGILNEEVWNRADSLSDFIQIEPYQGKAAKNKTTVKVLYSKEHLYVGVWCSDSLGKKAIRVPDMKRDFDWRAHDTFAICIDAFNDKRNSASFATNPYGAQKDYLSFDATLFDGDWNGLWKVRTSISDEGWFAEFQIPWKTLRYSRLAADSARSWGINFLRLRRATNEISAWSPYPRSFHFNRMEYAGVVSEILPPPPSTNIQVNPYSLLSYNKHVNPDQTTTQEYKYKVGGEVKWAVNSNTIADLTVNTDFAQADADVQVNNVSRFSVLFPEKRQFFLENGSLFGPGLIANGDTGGDIQMLPFFSRRIGLSDKGRPLPIDAGLRLVNRSIKQNIGLMAVQQRSIDTLPSSTSLVGRYSRNFGKQNRLGTIATMKSSDGNANVVGGVDGFLRFNAAQSLNFMALQSANSNGTEKGFGGYAQYYYTSNRITAWLTESVFTKNFSPALGFLSRTDVIGTTPGVVANLRGKHLPFKKFVRSYQPSVKTSWYHQASTRRLTERELKVTPFWIEMQDGGFYGFSVSDIRQNLISDFNPLGLTVVPGDYGYKRYSAIAGSDPSRKLSYSFKYDFGNYYNGSLQTTDFSVFVIPIPHISLKAGINRNRFKNVGTELDTKDIYLYTVQGRLALNPRVQLIGLYQRNSRNNLDSYNVRLAWEYKSLSYLYLVFNGRETFSNESVNTEQQGIFKISYLKQF
jgi:hypothetical protein